MKLIAKEIRCQVGAAPLELNPLVAVIWGRGVLIINGHCWLKDPEALPESSRRAVRCAACSERLVLFSD